MTQLHKPHRKPKEKWDMIDADIIVRMLEKRRDPHYIAREVRAPYLKVLEIKQQIII